MNNEKLIPYHEAMNKGPGEWPYCHVPGCQEGYVLNINSIKLKELELMGLDLQTFQHKQLEKDGVCYLPSESLIVHLIPEEEQKPTGLKKLFKKP